MTNLLEVIKKVKDRHHPNGNIDAEINSLFSIISKEIFEAKLEKSIYIKKIIDDKLKSINIADKQSFHIGKLVGLSVIVSQIKSSYDFENFALELDDAEINALLHIYNRRELVWEESSEGEIVSQISLKNSLAALNTLEKNKLIVNHTFSGKNFSTVSSKGDNVMKILQKRSRLNLASKEFKDLEIENSISIAKEKTFENSHHNSSDFLSAVRVVNDIEEDDDIKNYN